MTTTATANLAPYIEAREPGVTPWLRVRCPDGTVHTNFASTPEAVAFCNGDLLLGHCADGGEPHTIEVQP